MTNESLTSCPMTEFTVVDNKLISISYGIKNACLKITLPYNIDTVGEYVCENINAEEVLVGSNTKTLECYSFANTNLRKIILPYGLKTIERGAFSGSHSLEFANLPDTIEEIGKNAFSFTKLDKRFKKFAMKEKYVSEGREIECYYDDITQRDIRLDDPNVTLYKKTIFGVKKISKQEFIQSFNKKWV